MGRYTCAKSKFIKDLIKGMAWSDTKKREYIETLIDLEDVILNGTRSFGVGMWYNAMVGRYKKEWEAIYSELKPKEFRELLKQEAEKQKLVIWEREQAAKKRRKEEAMDKEDWAKAGGVI